MTNKAVGPAPIRTRVWRMPDNTLLFVRFALAQQMQHWVLLLAFLVLALTGFAEKYSEAGWAVFLTGVFGGQEAMRGIHHFFAALLIILIIFHVTTGLYNRIVNGQPWGIAFGRRDMRDAVQLLRYDLGRAAARPRFGHYSVEEKITYWFTVLTLGLMVVTGLVLWFPTRATEILPGEMIPLARLAHGWEAIITVIFVVIIHLYQTIVRAFNPSIFTGRLPEDQMRREHPLEYEAIMAQLSTPPEVTGQPESSLLTAEDTTEAMTEAAGDAAAQVMS